LNALVPHFTPFSSIYNHLSPLISLIPPFYGRIPPPIYGWIPSSDFQGLGQVYWGLFGGAWIALICGIKKDPLPGVNKQRVWLAKNYSNGSRPR